MLLIRTQQTTYRNGQIGNYNRRCFLLEDQSKTNVSVTTEPLNHVVPVCCRALFYSYTTVLPRAFAGTHLLLLVSD